MDRNIRIAREIIRLAKILAGAKVVPEHAMFKKDDVDKIQDQAEQNGLETSFSVDGDGMTAGISNGKSISVRLSDNGGCEYVVSSDEKDDEPETFTDIDEAIAVLFNQ